MWSGIFAYFQNILWHKKHMKFCSRIWCNFQIWKYIYILYSTYVFERKINHFCMRTFNVTRRSCYLTDTVSLKGLSHKILWGWEKESLLVFFNFYATKTYIMHFLEAARFLNAPVLAGRKVNVLYTPGLAARLPPLGGGSLGPWPWGVLFWAQNRLDF